MEELDIYKDIDTIKRLISFLRISRPDIVHVHSFKAGLLGRIAALLSGIPIIVMTVHGSVLQSMHPVYKKNVCILSELLLSKFTQKIITVSNNLNKEFVEEVKVKQDKVITIYNGISQNINHNKKDKNLLLKELGIPENKKIITTVARLAPQKGVAYFVRSAAEVMKEYKDVVFLVVGDGPLKKDLENLSMSLNLMGKIFFVGNRMDIDSIMDISDVFVLASLTEGLPLTVLEALQAQCPVVATEVGGIPEVIENGRNGLLVKAKSVSALSTAIKDLLSNPERSKYMGSQSGEILKERFSVDKMVKKTEEVYQNLYYKQI